jgi:hypothetical protein
MIYNKELDYMQENEYGVHAAHCCVLHGCKYGDEKCPVVNKKIKQNYTCEMCQEDGIDSVEKLYKTTEEKKIGFIIKYKKDGTYMTQDYSFVNDLKDAYIYDEKQAAKDFIESIDCLWLFDDDRPEHYEVKKVEYSISIKED